MLKRRQPARGQADMKNLFLASLALAAMIAAPATAADLPYKAPPPLPVAYYDWSGAYVGLNVGGTHYNVTHHFPSPGAVTPRRHDRRPRRHLRNPRRRAMAV